MVDVAATQEGDSAAVNSDKEKKKGGISPGFIKAGLAATLGGFFAVGVRSAWRHTKTPEAADLKKAQVLSGVAFASRALGVATLLSCSGFALLLLGVSALLNVNTPREFGRAMRSAFGDRLRLPQSHESLSAASLEELLTAIDAKKKKQKETEDNEKNVQLDVLLGAVEVWLIIVMLLIVCSYSSKCLPLERGSRVLLVTAHPDDEVMFFAPVLRQLRREGHTIYLLCISKGDAYGVGLKRKWELQKAVLRLGLDDANLTILDYDVLKDGDVWSVERLIEVILQHVESLDVRCVISFDGYGVSGHANHVALFSALQTAYTDGHVPSDTQIFVLESVPLFRKYLSLLDVPYSVLSSNFRAVSTPRDVATTLWAMGAHWSQLVWYRYLYMAFSRYILVNTFKRIPLRARHVKARTK